MICLIVAHLWKCVHEVGHHGQVEDTRVNVDFALGEL